MYDRLFFRRSIQPLQALIVPCFTWLVTALGVATVFVTRRINQKPLDTMLGFAVMMFLDAALGG